MALHDYYANAKSVYYVCAGSLFLVSSFICFIVYSKATFLSLAHLWSFSFFLFFAPPAIFLSVIGIHSYLREALCGLQQCRRDQEEGQPPPRGRDSELAERVDIVVSTTASEDVWKRKVYVALGCYAFLAVLCFTFGMAVWFTHSQELLKCGFIFCVGKRVAAWPGGARGTGPRKIHGFMIGCVFVPLGVVLAAHAFMQWRAYRRALVTTPPANDARDASRSSPPYDSIYKPYKAIRNPTRVFYLTASLFMLFMCALFSFYLPNDFHRLSAPFVAAGAAARVSPNYTSGIGLLVPEMSTALFRTRHVRINDYLYLKLFPGNLFFYLYLMLLVVLGYVLRWTRTGRSWFHRRLHTYPSWTLGECMLTVLTVLLTVLFSVYWLHDHNYKSSWSPKHETSVLRAEWWGRGLGQIAVLFLSLLLFPISRSSLLHDCLGTSWESFLKFHRLCGYAMLVATALHVLFFYVSFHHYGQLWHNFVHYPTICSFRGIRSDYTIVPLSIVTYLMFISMGIFAFHKLRRRFYELFYYTHIFVSLTIIPLTIVHAAAAWMYLLPGMTLWMADMFVRMWQRAAQVELVSARLVGDDVVEVRFRYPRTGLRRTIYAGQYVYVNFPQLSVLEWHPMTLAPPPPTPESEDARDVYAMYIKSMGTGTWTESLRDKVMKGGELTSIAIDGPYGHGVDMSDFEEVYMFAGGIGITPCATLFTSLLHTAQEGKPHPHYVRLTWSCRSAALVGALSEAMMLPSALCTLNQPDPEQPIPSASPNSGAFDEEPLADALPSGADGTTTAADHTEITDAASGKSATAGVFEGSISDLATEGFECYVHLTKAEEYRAARRVLDGAALPMEPPLVKTLVREGRPAVTSQLVALRTPGAAATKEGGPHKLFFVCGPEKLIHDVYKAAANIGGEVHVEEFEF